MSDSINVSMLEQRNELVLKKVLSTNDSGLVQPARLTKWLQSDYFSVEERSFSEWMTYLRRFAAHLRFFNDTAANNQSNSTLTGNQTEAAQNWAQSLPTVEQSLKLQMLLEGLTVSRDIREFAARPDIAVLLAFFTMMAHPKRQFNDFTQDHKLHYYREVLGFSEKQPLADKVHLVLSLDDDVTSMTLALNTRFDAGKDASGQPLVYQTLNNAVLNKAAVSNVKTLSGIEQVAFPSGEQPRRTLTECINVSSGLALDAEGALTFGDALNDSAELNEHQQFSRIGFSLATPSLSLSGGQRTINLYFHRGLDTEDTNILLGTWFDIAISTNEGMVLLSDAEPDDSWLFVDPGLWSISDISKNTNDADLTIFLDSLFPPVAGLSSELRPGVSPLPHVLFLLKPEFDVAAEVLKKNIFTSVTLDISVTGVSGLITESDLGELDTTTPFEPFSLQPRVGSRFTFTHPELLLKPISSASVLFEWLGRPVSFDNHYKPYSYYRYSILGDEAYLATTVDGTSDGKLCHAITDDKALFLPGCDCLIWSLPKLRLKRSDNVAIDDYLYDMFSSNVPINNIDTFSLQFVDGMNGEIYSADDLPISEKRPRQWPKWYSFTLQNNDFGHGDLSQVSQTMGYFNSRYIQSEGIEHFTPITVTDPYTPLSNNLTLNYESTTEIPVDSLSDFELPLLQYVHPLGRPRIPENTAVSFLPRLPESAYLFLGVSGFSGPGQLRLYFQIEPVDGSNIADGRLVDWRFLTPDGWQFLPGSAVGVQDGAGRIIEDSTQQLLNSGVVAFELPLLPEQLSGLGDGFLWLQVSIFNEDTSPVRYSTIKGIYSQGVVAQLVMDNNDPTHFQQPLAAETVAGLEIPDPRIKSVFHPWPSFSARPAETVSALEVRASEHLRHKRRALTRWDYEHLILENFPEVYLARCYIPTDEYDASESNADIFLMLVPVNHDENILQPKLPLYLHQEIESFINQLSPAGVNVSVRDPAYEEIIFDVALKIKTGYDIDSVVSEINQNIIDFLTPWQGLNNQQTQFKQAVYATEVAGMLEQHMAVDTVHHVRATVIRADGSTHSLGHSLNILTPSAESAILVPSRSHKVVLVDQDVAIVEGIGLWRIEIDFSVGKEILI